MMKFITANALVTRAIDIAKNYKTLYVMGAFGSPLTASNKNRFLNNLEYNRRSARQGMIKTASADTFAFDCSGLIKGIMWGWHGDYADKNGGAMYGNGIPDINADTMIARSEASSDFTNVMPGEVLWTNGHIGVYIGNGEAVECTPSFDNKVQITTVGNIKRGSGHVRNWKKHGKLKYVDYAAVSNEKSKSTTDIAKEVIAGKWGNMPERKKMIEAAGYNYDSVRAIVNRLMKGAN